MRFANESITSKISDEIAEKIINSIVVF
jgi:hypothetical protein